MALHQTTDIPDTEFAIYPYRQFAIDDEDEWLSWSERHYADLTQRDLKVKIKMFEAQQKAIYNLLDADRQLTKAAFQKRLSTQLSEMGFADVYDNLSLNDISHAFDFYLTKHKIFEAKVAEHAATNECIRTHKVFKDAETNEAVSKRIVLDDEDAYHRTFRGSFTVPSAIGLGIGATLNTVGNASALVLTAAKEAVVAFPQYVPASLPQACATGLSALAGHVGSAQNASLVVAATAGLSTFVAVKTTLYATRRLARRRARAELTVAREKLRKQATKRDHAWNEIIEAGRTLKRARLSLEESIQADNTGTNYDEKDVGDDDDEEEEEGEEEEEEDHGEEEGKYGEKDEKETELEEEEKEVDKGEEKGGDHNTEQDESETPPSTPMGTVTELV